MDVVFVDEEKGIVVTIRATNGSFVTKETVLLDYRNPANVICRLMAPEEGVVTFERNIKRGTVLEHCTKVGIVCACSHEIVMKDMCATCGTDLRIRGGRAGQRREDASANVSMVHHVPELIVSNELAKEIGNLDQQALLAARKLVLLVDLDQTVIHTTNKPFVIDPEKHEDVCSYRLYNCQYTTKVRPHTREFLLHMSKLFEMHIVTYGQRLYAHRMAQLLDPDRTIFRERILSRDELFSQQHKTNNLRALFPNGDELVVIIDDRADVWQFSDALVQVKPYRFFREVGDINAPPDAPNKEPPPVDVDPNSEHDGILERVEKVMVDVHEQFFKHYDTGNEKKIRDVKTILSYLRKKVLKDCKFVFSGIVPQGTRIEQSELYRISKAFGAEIEDTITSDTTHVIAARWGTDKVHIANRKGVRVVKRDWVYACSQKWMQVSEDEFLLTPADVGSDPQRRLGAPETADIEIVDRGTLADMQNEVDEALSDDDDDDDDDEDDEQNDGEGEDTRPQEASVSHEDEASPTKRVLEHIEEEGGEVAWSSKRRRRLESTGEGEEEALEESDDGDEDGEEMDYPAESRGDAEEYIHTRSEEDDSTRDVPLFDEDDDDDFDDMAASIERQMSEGE